ncbi:heme ABC exporter ATP-binding protein CcmA [Polycladidibacter hongkongensis]|uniref:heme ABC exporter ATP-binding protein CcmA n=1 Tax=Polycladidibacter hongkongensis TaxID=1647556 RepID=UPI000831A622|nr:heme ABC exporter ATP-binding protein CcmA [Pseudovibrio hongkongensis]
MTSQKMICQGLSCERGGRRVLSDVSFELDGGAALLIKGPNGVGKSSLLRTLAGLVSASAGTIALEGGREDCRLGEQSHYFGHLDALKPALSTIENLRFWQEFYEPHSLPNGTGAIFPDLEAALEAVGIGHTTDLPSGYLSAGQRRRLSFARLLSVPRPVWLLDEPTSALDAASEERMLGFMEQHMQMGGMVIAATHLPLSLANVGELNLSAVQGPAGGSDATAEDTQAGMDDWFYD